MHLTKQELRALIRRNPDLKLPIELKDAQISTSLPAASSPLEERFLQIWRSLDGPELVREYRFDKVRKWRIDFYHEAARIGIEIDGGLWGKGGRHNRATGYMHDAEKINAAAMQGITMLRLTSNLITEPYIHSVLEFVCRVAADDARNP